MSPGIEIEVWPKAGQSAYAVVDPTVAILIAKRLLEMAAVQLAPAAANTDEADDAEEVAAEPGTIATAAPDATENELAEAPEVRPSNGVDLASRRRPSAS
jgi:hypothetical protein